MPFSRDHKVMLVIGVLFALLGVAVEYGNVSGDLLLIAPLLCLAVPLLSGTYVGEEQIARLAAAVCARRRPRRAPAAVARPRRLADAFLVRGRLLGAAHACRPPPAHLLS